MLLLYNLANADPVCFLDPLHIYEWGKNPTGLSVTFRTMENNKKRNTIHALKSKYCAKEKLFKCWASAGKCKSW